MWISFGLFLFSSILVFMAWMVIFIISWRQIKGTPSLAGWVKSFSGALASLPSLALIVPAKDEIQNIQKCLFSLLKQDYPQLRLVVAEDNSSDGTFEEVAEIFNHFSGAGSSKVINPQLLKVPSLPPGWFGKSHALHWAVKQIEFKGEWLLFVDADTRLAPQLVSMAVSYAQTNNLDMLSLYPQFLGGSFWERLLQPSIGALIASLHPPELVNREQNLNAFANGQFILIRRQVYQLMGGHEAVRTMVLEDVELARLTRQKGFKVAIISGIEMLKTRMYRNLGEIISGWQKNMFALMGHSWLRTLLTVFFQLFMSFSPLVLLVTGLVGTVLNQGFLWLLTGLAVYLTGLICQTLLRAKGKAYPRYASLAPLSALFTSYIVISSALICAMGIGVSWKGRRY